MVSEATDRGRQKLAVERKNDWTKMVSFVHDSSGKYCMPLLLEKESAAYLCWLVAWLDSQLLVAVRTA